MSLLPHYDKIADRACRRHDHGARYEVVGIFVKLGCDADHDLAKAGKHNNAVSAVFGDWGLAGAWGCFDKGDYYCWRWKKRGFIRYPAYGKYCEGESTRYGPWRFKGYKHRYGYAKKEKRCDDDIF